MSNDPSKLHIGDATFQKRFEKVVYADNGNRFTFGFSAPKGRKFVTLLIGDVDAKAEDADLDALLANLGYVRSES